MDNRDDQKINKKHHSKVWDTISFWLSLCAILLPWILGISLLIAGLSALIEKEPFLFVLKEMFFSLLSSVFLYPVIIIVLLAVVGLFLDIFASHPILGIVLIIAIALAFPAGSSAVKNSFNSSSNHITQKHVQTQWDNFEKISRLGDYYRDISDDYGTLSDESVMNGGVFLRGSNDLYYAFPKYSKADIIDTDPCTGMAGTAEAMFGYNESITVSELKDNLGLTSESEFEGNLIFKKTSSNGYYYVSILSDEISNDSDLLTPDTWVSVIPRDRTIIPVGSLASDQNATRETVFFVEDGNRYHRDSSCSTLHDSDVIYECYLDEVPDGRSECGVCN